MLKYIYLILLFSVISVPAQNGFGKGERNKPELNIRKAIFIESNIIPSDSNFICCFSYKIPFNNILFLKDGNNFTGAISLKMEVHRDEQYLKSETVTKKITVDNYPLTNSETDFLEGLLTIKLPEGEYQIKPSLKIENLNKDILLHPFPLKVENEEPLYIYKPIPVYYDKYKSGDASYFRLVNSEGFLPYSIQNYNIIIPVADSTVNEINVSIEQDDKEIVNEKYYPEETLRLDIALVNNAVCLTDNPGFTKTKLFLIKDFSTKLFEGTAKLKVAAGDEEKIFDINIGWLNKPKTLYNAEFAIKILENITPGDEVNELTDGDEEDYYKNLVNFWKKFDQNKVTAFNEVMNEFYSRADYAVKEYSTPNNRNGAATDRGKIYIKYGKPDNISRSYSEKDHILEIWTYNSTGKKFVFADNNGLGNFTLLK